MDQSAHLTKEYVLHFKNFDLLRIRVASDEKEVLALAPQRIHL